MLEEFQKLRNKLIGLVERGASLQSPEVLEVSRQLDRLINGMMAAQNDPTPLQPAALGS